MPGNIKPSIKHHRCNKASGWLRTKSNCNKCQTICMIMVEECAHLFSESLWTQEEEPQTFMESLPRLAYQVARDTACSSQE